MLLIKNYISLLYQQFIQNIKDQVYIALALQKEYIRLGGKYKGENKQSGKKWLDEAWVQIVPFLESQKIVKCGEGSDSKSCRPTIRVDKKTPITIKELIKKHGKSKLLAFAKKKKANMDLRANWNTLTFS